MAIEIIGKWSEFIQYNTVYTNLCFINIKLEINKSKFHILCASKQPQRSFNIVIINICI